MPSGSRKICCRSFSGNFTILSSIDGQYLGPIPSIVPEYKGDLCRFERIISAVFCVVNVMKQLNWPLILSKIDPGGYFPAERPLPTKFLADCSMWNKSSFQNVKYGTGSSPD